MPKNWTEIKAKGPRSAADEAAHFLIQAGSPGVIEDDNTLPRNTLVLYSSWDEVTDEPISTSPEAAYRAYLENPAIEGLEILKENLKGIGWSISASIFKEEDWSKKWMSGIKPVRVSYGKDSVVVKPTWKDIRKRPGDVVIEIDPGMAFGTGGHATTRMCLRAILTLLKRHRGLTTLLDVGTGTGVLAIAAKKLKVKKAVGTEIDSVALKVARGNCRHNGADVALSSSPVENIKGVFSVVVANILANELVRLSSAIFKKTSPGGFLILSGILNEESSSVKDAYRAIGLKFIKAYSSGEWSTLIFQRPVQVK